MLILAITNALGRRQHTRVTKSLQHRHLLLTPTQRLSECLHTTVDLGVFAFNAWLHDARVTEDDDRGGTDEPEEGSQWRSPKEEWDPDHEKTGVELRLGDGTITKL